MQAKARPLAKRKLSENRGGLGTVGRVHTHCEHTKNAPIKPLFAESIDQLFKRMYTNELLNLKKVGFYRHTADFLTSKGYDTTDAYIGQQKDKKIAFGVVPVTAKTIRLLNVLLEEFPSSITNLCLSQNKEVK